MNYYSTNGNAPIADLRKAVVKGLAEDRGLYMPERINKLPKAFFDDMPQMTFQDIAYNVASAFFGEDVDLDSLKDLVYDTLQFDCPVVKVKENIYSLELFHGPTLAFKDVGARFMARLLQYFIKEERGKRSERRGERAGGYQRRHGFGCGQRLPGRRRHSRLRALSEGQGVAHPGMPVHDIRT